MKNPPKISLLTEIYQKLGKLLVKVPKNVIIDKKKG